MTRADRFLLGTFFAILFIGIAFMAFIFTSPGDKLPTSLYFDKDSIAYIVEHTDKGDAPVEVGDVLPLNCTIYLKDGSIVEKKFYNSLRKRGNELVFSDHVIMDNKSPFKY